MAKWKNKCERTHMERSRCWCRCRCRWMPLSGLARSGRVWSVLVWADYWPHGRHALFGRAVCNCAPSAALWDTHTRTHSCDPHSHIIPLARATSKPPKKKPQLTAPLLMVFGLWFFYYRSSLSSWSLSLSLHLACSSHENVHKYLRRFM